MAYKYPKLVGGVVIAGLIAMAANSPMKESLRQADAKAGVVTTPKIDPIYRLALLDGVVVEPEAQISDEFKDVKFLKATQLLVQLHKYRCDSISSAIAYVFSSKDGLTLRCNYHRYSYSLTDYGGNWKVELN
jgi:hypothetical protein